MSQVIYDGTNVDGSDWPRWWEIDDDPDVFGAQCVICGEAVEHPLLHANVKAIEFEVDNDAGSGFCVCTKCVQIWGKRPSLKNIDRHDRAVLQRFSAIYTRLIWEIMNGRESTGRGDIGAVQPRWANPWAHQ